MTDKINIEFKTKKQANNNENIVSENANQDPNLINISDDDRNSNELENSDSDSDSDEYEDEGEDSEDEDGEDEDGEDEDGEDEKDNNIDPEDTIQGSTFLGKPKDKLTVEELGVENSMGQLSNLMKDFTELNTKEDPVLELKMVNDGDDSLDELSDLEADDEDHLTISEEVFPDDTKNDSSKQNLSKLTVAILKNLAEKKGLTQYKSLKKAALIKLIEDN
jgi:hypothetical protein